MNRSGKGPRDVAPGIHVTIDRLVLNGFSPGQQRRLSMALRESLARELAANAGLLRSSPGRRENIESPSVRDAAVLTTFAADAAQRILQGLLK